MNEWDQRYDCEDFVYGTEPNDFLREHADVLPAGGEILCLADGEGRNSVFLAERGFHPTALDYSAVALEKGRRLAEERGVVVERVQADLADYTLDRDRWDGIVSIFCHVPAPIRERIYRQVPEALRPGGVLLLEAYTPKQLEYGTGGPPTTELLAGVEELLRPLQGLELLHARELERPVIEGRLHTGPAHVVQIIARRGQD